MASREQSEEAPDLEPWANDERLQDVIQQPKINKVVRIILRLVDAMEKAPIGPMPKTKSIPRMWEMVKDLNSKKISDLQDACREHAEYGAIGQQTEHENFACDLANLQKKSNDKSPADEMIEADEEEVPSSKERKGTASDIFSVLPDEGTCVNSNFNCMTLCPLLRTHALCYCYSSNNCACFVWAYTYAHAVENPAARTCVDTHVLDNTSMQNCCYSMREQTIKMLNRRVKT
jgi:hypothetical protein